MFTVDIPYKGVVYSTKFPWKIGIVSFMLYPEMMAGKGDIVANIRGSPMTPSSTHRGLHPD